jgi:methionyl-tRNA synthetase
MTGKFYITTPAYYPNDVPHIGHAYTTIAADVIARWKRLEAGPANVMFITGLDEHGKKLEQAAQEQGMAPQQFVDMMAEKFKQTWKLLNISYDQLIRTTDKSHSEIVNRIFDKIYKKGDIYKGVYEDWYCVPCESYYTQGQLENGNCPSCKRPVEKLREDSYFFKLSNYQEKLLEYFEQNPDFISPSSRRKEIINRVKEGLRDLSISRTKVKWGIPVPIDHESTLYVWMDALQFYITALKYPGAAFERFWPPDVQLMSKEINWFHSVIFPSLLMSAGLPIAKRVHIHGWLTVNGEKMSKSLGNFVKPEELADKYSVDALRYFLIREIPFGEDGDFSEKSLVERINGELVSDLGNLVNRVMTLAEGVDVRFAGTAELDKKLNFEKIQQYMNKLELHHAIEEIFNFVRAVNKYINENEPWKLIKETNGLKRSKQAVKSSERLGHVLYNLLESLRVIAILISPFMPGTAGKINEQLGIEECGSFKDLTFRPFKGTLQKGPLLFKKIQTK